MADIPVAWRDVKYYNPDGGNAPINFVLPLGAQDGSIVSFINTTTSTSPVTVTAQGGQQVQDQFTEAFGPTATLDYALGKYQYMLFDNKWWLLMCDDTYDLVRELLQVLCYRAYGGLDLTAPPSSPVDIPASPDWVKLPIFDSTAIATPAGIVQNLANDSIQYEIEGVYAISVSFAMNHNNVNRGRTVYWRLFNETDGIAAAGGIAIGIGRNVEDSSSSVTAIAEVTPGNINKDIILQIGNGTEAISGVVFTSASWSTWSVGEYRGPSLI